MSAWSLHLLGVGNAAAVELGSAMATIERDGRPWLTIDCGGEGLSAFEAAYRDVPRALFMTHAHMDHIAGFERLFVSAWFDPALRGEIRLYVPVTLLPLLHQRVASYPNALAEGGVNFWEAFRVIPVSDHVWHDGHRLDVFPARHHWPETAFGLRLPGSVVWTGDTRPIPEMLAKYAGAGELVAHDCALEGNPSHSGIEDLEREYPRELLDRCVLYHYASAEDGRLLRARGYRVGLQGERWPLADPILAEWP
jgi:ribonuclease BN (tRNA processing enzyme)